MKILLIDVVEFCYQGFRLPQAIHELGHTVEALCQPTALIFDSVFVNQCYTEPFKSTQTLSAQLFIETVLRANPDAVIALNDESRDLFLQIAAIALQKTQAETVFKRLIANSFAPIEWQSSLKQRRTTSLACQSLQVATPDFIDDLTPANVCAFMDKIQSDIIVKLDATEGGAGVARYHHQDEWLEATQQHHQQGVAQRFVEGQMAMFGFSAYQGNYLDGIGVLKLETQKLPFGQSSVVESITHPMMEQAARKFCQHFNYSGFGSLDFIIDSEGTAQVIEFNHRITKLIHMGYLFNADPLAAWLHALSQQDYEPKPIHTGLVVAMFPYEWSRNANSPYLKTGLHDVPWAEPVMMKRMIQRINPRGVLR